MKATTKSAVEKYGKQVNNKSYEAKIERALTLKDTIESLKVELEEIKEFFFNEFDLDKTTKSIVTAKGVAVLKQANSYSVLPEKLQSLKDIFGDFMPQFVTEKTSYGASSELKKLLANADYKHINTIREAVTIKVTPSVDFQQLNA